jgi:hypothetical protein
MNDMEHNPAAKRIEHAIKRGEERYGGVTVETEHEIIKKIRHAIKRFGRPPARPIFRRGRLHHTKPFEASAVCEWGRNDPRQAWHVITDEGRHFWVVFEPASRKIITYLPPNPVPSVTVKALKGTLMPGINA